MRRGKITAKILDALRRNAEITANLLDIVIADFYSAHWKSRRFSIGKFHPSQTTGVSEGRKRQQFYALLNRLKNQGLIAKSKVDSGGTIWKITKRGLKKIKVLENRGVFENQAVSYKKEMDQGVKVIIFDIPEKERHKRNWLRTVLASLGFDLLQRSVWVGQCKVPEDFIRDLRSRKMLSYVHIFEINKKGTIAKVP